MGDSVIVSLLSRDDPDHGAVMADFIDCCNLSFFDINYQEIVIDLRKNPTLICPVEIKDQAVEVVHHYKYLGTVIYENWLWGSECHFKSRLKRTMLANICLWQMVICILTHNRSMPNMTKLLDLIFLFFINKIYYAYAQYVVNQNTYYLLNSFKKSPPGDTKGYHCSVMLEFLIFICKWR